MTGVSRRVFLKGSSAALVAAGTLSAVPALPALVGALGTEAPLDADASGAAAADGAGVAAGDALVAHVRDLSSGVIALFSGTDEVTVVDPRLAAALARAVR